MGEKELVSLVEMLMNQLLRLESITVDGDVKLQRKMQVWNFLFKFLLLSNFDLGSKYLRYVTLFGIRVRMI